MRDARALLRLTAIVLVTVLALTLAAPARAEANVLWAVGIAGIVVIVVIVVVYLVVASSRGPQMSAESQPVMIACVESDAEPRSCWSTAGVPVPAASAPAALPAPLEAVPQS